MISLLLALLVTPNLRVTPGLVRPLTTAQVCAVTWGVDARHVTVAMKRQVFTAYGIRWAQRDRWVIDHLVPRELAGADNVLNLWPQPRQEAKQKDVDENRLHKAVCHGTVSLAAAQDQIQRWGR